MLIEQREGPEKMQSTTVKYTYRLLNTEKSHRLPQRDVSGGKLRGRSLLDLWGIGRDIFQSLGGADAFIRKERESFDGDEKRS